MHDSNKPEKSKAEPLTATNCDSFEHPDQVECVEGANEPFSIFDKRQKRIIVLIVSIAATFSGFASNIYFPAIPAIAKELDVSIELITLTVTTYLIFQGLAPSLWGPISDVKGRKVAYCCTFIVLLGACIGLALAKNYATVMVLRCIQSTGSASTIAIGSGVIGDITTRSERGGFMGVFQAGLLVPVAIGPVIGGALAGSLGWRSIFWFLSIYSGTFLCILIVSLPETLRSIVSNGSRLPSTMRWTQRFPLSVYQRGSKLSWTASTGEGLEKKKVDITGPFRILVKRSAAPLVLFVAIHYAVWQMSITAMAALFEDEYNLSQTEIGLTFIANGVGSSLGTLITGRMMDMDYRRVKAKFDSEQASPGGETEKDSTADSRSESDFPLEKARLRLVPVFSLLQCLSLVVFGWSLEYSHKVHIAVPIISTFVTGWVTISSLAAATTYLVDIHPDQGAAASASINLARCLFAAAGTSFVMPLVKGVGAGLAFTICVIAMAFSWVLIFVQWKFGVKWRHEEEARRDCKSEG